MSQEPSSAIRYEFADRLEAAQGEPLETFAALRDGWLMAGLDVSLGLTPELMAQPPNTVGEASAKNLDVLGRLAAYFSRHGTPTPVEQGEWFTAPTDRLWFADKPMAPLTILLLGPKTSGPFKNNIGRVVSAAQPFLNPTRQGQTEARDIILSGEGDFTLHLY